MSAEELKRVAFIGSKSAWDALKSSLPITLISRNQDAFLSGTTGYVYVTSREKALGQEFDDMSTDHGAQSDIVDAVKTRLVSVEEGV